MDEENKPKSHEQIIEENIKEEKNRMERIEKIRLETIERLQNDEDIQKYFEQFNQHTVDSFIKNYASIKGQYMEYGGKFAQYSLDKNLSYYEDAYQCVKLIQIKKLFDLRCQWGANLIPIEGVEITWDFLTHSADIFNCPFLTPISASEFALFMSYAHSQNFERATHIRWLDIADIRAANEEEERALPEWFYFNNIYTGGNRFLQMPDIRDEKESFYRDLFIEERDSITKEKIANGELPQPPVMDSRPGLISYHYDVISDFVKRFEDETTRKKFEGYQDFASTLSKNPEGNDDYLNEQAEELARELTKVVPAPAIESNSDWRVAIINTWHKYENEQTIAALPTAYEDYLFHIENNISFENTERADHYKEMAKSVKEQILRGRELNNEPRDLNF